MTDISRYLVNPELTIREALQKLDANRGEILLVIGSDGRMLRTLSDGDIRRALLDNAELSDGLTVLPDKQPWTISLDDQIDEAFVLMQENGIECVPQVDGHGRPVRLLRRRDFEETVWLSSPHMGKDELRYVHEAFETNWIAPLGPNVDAFEREIAAEVGVEHAAALSSGTAALHLALVTTGVGKGDIVFCPDFTFVATVNPVLYQGATPVLIDSEPNSWNMSADALERALHEYATRDVLPKAIIIANIYGQQAEMDAIMPVAEQFSVPVIEDAAESLGASYKGRASGSFGACGVFSFNGNKIITTSGGGMLVSEDGELIQRARFLSTQAKETAPYYLHHDLGYNYRMSNVLAGIGRGQLSVLHDRVARRREINDEYRAAFADLPGISWMKDPQHSLSTHWLSVMLVDGHKFGASTDGLINYLQGLGIEARRAWRPMHMQPLFEGTDLYAHLPNDVPCSRRHFESGVCLPSGTNMTDGQLARTIDAVLSCREKIAVGA